METSPEAVGEVLVDTPDGVKIPLKALARISEESGPNLISRENAQRKIVVQCNVAGRDLGSVVADIRRAVAERVQLPPGYYVRYGGQFESAQETRRRLGVLGLAVVCGIGFLLHVVFRSASDALLIMVNLPLALIGGVAGVFLSGGVLSVASLIGLISVFGIAARNGIMMVSHIRHLQRFEGVTDFRQAVRHSFRPARHTSAQTRRRRPSQSRIILRFGKLIDSFPDFRDIRSRFSRGGLRRSQPIPILRELRGDGEHLSVRFRIDLLFVG